MGHRAVTPLTGVFAGLLLAVSGTAYAQATYHLFSPGGALSGTWNSQNVNLAAGGSFITGVLPSTNGGAVAQDIQVFTSSGTWTKPTTGTPVSVHIIMMGPGGGGGGGARVAAATAASGGGGGGGGLQMDLTMPATAVGATESVVIGAAGAAGAGATVDGNAGTNGTQGGISSFGTTYFVVPGGGGGAGGQVSGNSGGGGGGNISIQGAQASGATAGNSSACGTAGGSGAAGNGSASNCGAGGGGGLQSGVGQTPG